MWGKKIFIFPHGTWKDNLRSVILDWRQRPAGHSSRPDSCVCSPAVLLLHKKGPCHRRLCVNPPWLYSYYTQSSPSKNKNINYIFIYLRVLRRLSSCAIYYNQLIYWISYTCTFHGDQHKIEIIDIRWSIQTISTIWSFYQNRIICRTLKLSNGKNQPWNRITTLCSTYLENKESKKLFVKLVLTVCHILFDLC